MARHLYLSTHRALTIVVCAAGLCSSLAALAQGIALRPRITAQIDNSQRSMLAGSRPSRALAANDTGAVAPNMELHGITLVFSRTPAQQTALNQLAATQQNPASPSYHRWLTPDQYATQFGLADADIATVQTWLEQQGFAVGSVARSHNRISFSGTAAQVANAFGASLHYYKASDESIRHFAPSANLSIPAALAPVIEGVGNLSSYRPHPNVVIAPPKPQPSYTAGGDQVVFLTPPDVATIYDVNPAYGSGYNGTGQTIAIVGQSAVVAQDLADFQTAIGVPVNPQTLNLIPGTGTSTIVSGDETESDLDLEYASAMAPGAAVSFYYVGDSGSDNVYDSLTYVIDNDLASIISLSYVTCEPNMGSGTLDAVLEQAAVQGQTVVVAAGDYGSTSCMEEGTNSPALQDAPAVNYPASSPWVVALGGTQFISSALTNPINTTYWAVAPDGNAVSTALTYIPEIVWNDGDYGLGEGGGGTSIFEPRPLWQTGVPGIAAGSGRLVPDISLASSDVSPGYLICSSDTEWSFTGSCTTGFVAANGHSYNTIGGTSVAAPVFAGLVAVLNQAKGYSSGQGLINPTLYTLASNSTTYDSAFHDITTGGNNCSVITACGTGPQNTEYLAGVGYDEASGLGSIDFANLLSAWPESTGAGAVTTTTTLSASTASAVYGSTVTFTATVSGGTGTVTFLEGASPLGVGQVNSSGVASLSLSTLPYGTDSVTAAYGGTTGYSTSTSTAVVVNVTASPSTTTLISSSLNPSYGASVILTATVTANGSPVSSGVVTFLNGAALLGEEVVSSTSNGVVTLNTYSLPSGADSITANYDGLSNYGPSISSPVTVTVTPETTTTTITTTTTTTNYGSSVAFTATVAATNGGPATSGVVTFLNGATALGTGTVNSSGVATFSLSTLPGGANSITARYAATSNFAASVSSSVIVTVARASTSTNLATSSSTPAFGSSVAFTATVAANGSPVPSGVVTFFDGTSMLGTGAVNGNGVATFSLSILPSGADSITASYGATSNFAASVSSPVIVTVAPATTTINLSSSSSSPVFGSSVAFTATVAAEGSPVTSGVVTFLDGASALGTGAVNGNGVATFSLSTLPSGADSITASYAATSSFATSVSNPVLVTVAPATTTTALTTSSSSPAYGASVALTATVSVAGSPATSGDITFLSNGTAIGTGAVNSSGVATISLSTLPSGADTITAKFGNAPNLAASTSNAVLVTVAPAAPIIAATTTTLSASSSSTTYGDTVTFTVVVASGDAPVASGGVSLTEGGNSIGSGTLNSSGVAMISLSTLPVGSNTISAYYAGTANFATSLSSAVTVTVAAPANPGPPATITVSTPSPVSPGSEATAAVSLAAGSSYAGTMNLTCTLTSSPVGAQYLPTCSVTPSTLTVAENTTAASTLTVQTTSTTTVALARPSGLTPWGLGGASAMAGLFMFCVPTRRRRMMSLLALLLVVLSVGAVGCGGGTSSQGTTSNQTTTAGSYTFTVIGTDASNPSTTSSASVTLTVE